jgi:hypothetical protein
MQQYQNHEYFLQFNYPENWGLAENRELGGIQVKPAADGHDVQSGKLSIIVRPQQSGGDDVGTLSFIASEIIRTNFGNYEDHILYSLRQSAIGNVQAREFIFSYQDEARGEKMQALQIIAMARGHLYLFTYTATGKRFSENLQPAAEIMESVQFI